MLSLSLSAVGWLLFHILSFISSIDFSCIGTYICGPGRGMSHHSHNGKQVTGTAHRIFCLSILDSFSFSHFYFTCLFFLILSLKNAEPHLTGYTNMAACLVFHQTWSTCILLAPVCVHLLLKCHDVCKEANPPCWHNNLSRLKIRQQPVIDSRSHIIYTELTGLLSSHVFLRCCVTVENHHTPCQKPIEVVSAAVICTRLSLWLICFDCTDYAVKLNKIRSVSRMFSS